MNTEARPPVARFPWKGLAVSLLVLLVIGLVWRANQPYSPPPPLAEEGAAQAVAAAPARPAVRLNDPAVMAERLGIEIKAIQVGVDNTRLALRYRVLDSERATALTNWIYQARLIDQAGRDLLLPVSPNPAPLRRESGQQLKADRIYTHFFPNPARSVKPGDKVTLVIGNLRAENLVVQ